MMNRILVLLFLTAFSSSQAQEVKIHLNGAIDIYKFEPTLEQVLKRHVDQEHWYWPASTLFRKSNEPQEIERTEILAQLALVKSDVTSEDADTAITSLMEVIKEWKLASNMGISLDYDLVRLKEANNPIVNFGEYFLQLRKRPTKIQYFGFVSEAGELLHQSATDVSKYLKEIEYSDFADRDYVYVINPNGKVEKAKVAYWENEHFEVAPGSTIYVPLKETLFSNFANLNLKIATLAGNRLP